MHEVLRKLRAGTLVLDLGCAGGSFPPEATAATVVRVDREPPVHHAAGARFVQADAARLPFADGTFSAVISNHSLEHFDDLAGALSEIGRVIAPGGALFVAVPDASTFTDRLYRWLARGGGHVNAFTSATETAATIERGVGLPHAGTRPLCSSLSFLNRRNAPGPAPRRLLLLGGGYEWSLFLYGWVSRRLDRWVNTRTSIYGWAFYFGEVARPIDTETWVNVCIRCGGGYAGGFLTGEGLVRSSFPGLRVWRCPGCGAVNPFANDRGG
jgi:SAM-dependent methyltransferase